MKKVESKGSIPRKLTPAESRVLVMLTKEFLTIKKIAIRRETSVQAVYKIVKKLKEKGVLGLAYSSMENRVENIQPTQLNQIRLHAQEFNIRIIHKTAKYKATLKKANTLYIDGNTIRLFNNSIEIYSGHSFYADDVQKATSKSLSYWNRLITRLEQEIGAILIKSSSQNIKQINAHYSETNNELAEGYNKKKVKLRIYTREDGKLWFVIDNSYNLDEAETLHPQTSKQDMERVKDFFNDIRDKNPPKLSELMFVLKETEEINKETAAGVNILVNMFKSQVKAQEPKDMKPKERPDYIG